MDIYTSHPEIDTAFGRTRLAELEAQADALRNGFDHSLYERLLHGTGTFLVRAGEYLLDLQRYVHRADHATSRVR